MPRPSDPVSHSSSRGSPRPAQHLGQLRATTWSSGPEVVVAGDAGAVHEPSLSVGAPFSAVVVACSFCVDFSSR
jgi:hypothetical protein